MPNLAIDPAALCHKICRPIAVNTFTPLELVQSYFVRLGVRYLVVVDGRGALKGVIFKKRWLAFLASLEED